jgi:ribose transport system permease protein
VKRFVQNVGAGQGGLIAVMIALCVVMTIFAGTHEDRSTHHMVNNFLNANTLLQVATDASFFAIMAVGMTMVIVSGGIDLSIGSTYAMCGVLTALVLKGMTGASGPTLVIVGLGLSVGIGLLAGLVNGIMVARLGVHPFIITLGTLWVFRGIAFITSKAVSILLPLPVTEFAKASFGLGTGLYPLPTITMIFVGIAGALYLGKTAMGRRIFAVGGNVEAARYAGLNTGKILTGVYIVAGLTAGIAAFVGNGFYGSASSGDATGYELYVIASAVVGGASLTGGKGTATGAILGALLITLIRQSIRTLGLDQNYESIIIGSAIVIAVVVDRWSARAAERRLARSA